jgi:hypothetical protein
MNEEPDADNKTSAQRAADIELNNALIDLAANLIRVVRGAGKSYQVGRDMAAGVRAYERYHQAYGHWPPSWEVSGILRLERAEYDDDRATYTICRGALQIVASALLGQRPQRAAGETEVAEGIRYWEAARARTQRP